MNTTICANIKKDKIISKIALEFPSNKIYIVGGTVRDCYLGHKSFDRDLIIEDMDAKEFAQKLHSIFDSAYIPLDEKNKIYRIVLHEKEEKNTQSMIDVTNPLGGSLETDLRRRDLTINAIAIDIHTWKVIDLFNGTVDLENKLLKQIEENNFTDDPLRLLRVFRFQAQLGFNISQDTIDTISKYSALISNPAPERVCYELMKLFNGKYTDYTLINMDKTHLLEKIFPVVSELKQVPPNSHHHLNLYEHSIETVKQIQLLYNNSDERIKNHLDKIEFGGFSRLAHLKLAGFLHDIGKFSTWTIDNDTGRHRFIKHDEVGAQLAKPLLKTLSFSNKQITYLTDMIRNHIYPSQLMTSEEVNEKAMTRYLRKLQDNVIDNIILAKADRLSARGKVITDDIVKSNIKNLDKLLEFYFCSLETLKPLPKLLDGNDIMRILNIKPGKELGEIISAMQEAQLNSEIITKDDAEKFIRSFKHPTQGENANL